MGFYNTSGVGLEGIIKDDIVKLVNILNRDNVKYWSKKSTLDRNKIQIKLTGKTITKDKNVVDIRKQFDTISLIIGRSKLDMVTFPGKSFYLVFIKFGDNNIKDLICGYLY